MSLFDLEEHAHKLATDDAGTRGVREVARVVADLINFLRREDDDDNEGEQVPRWVADRLAKERDEAREVSRGHMLVVEGLGASLATIRKLFNIPPDGSDLLVRLREFAENREEVARERRANEDVLRELEAILLPADAADDTDTREVARKLVEDLRAARAELAQCLDERGVDVQHETERCAKIADKHWTRVGDQIRGRKNEEVTHAPETVAVANGKPADTQEPSPAAVVPGTSSTSRARGPGPNGEFAWTDQVTGDPPNEYFLHVLDTGFAAVDAWVHSGDVPTRAKQIDAAIRKLVAAKVTQ